MVSFSAQFSIKYALTRFESWQYFKSHRGSLFFKTTSYKCSNSKCDGNALIDKEVQLKSLTFLQNIRTIKGKSDYGNQPNRIIGSSALNPGAVFLSFF